MSTVWFFLVAAMLVTYAVLDGFDFGAGALHVFVAKTDEERRVVLGAIGPVWDGNEVWLVAAGGVLLFAFPRVYSAALSGLYLPLMMVLWLLLVRGITIEFRSKVDHPLWRTGFDGAFTFASAAMAVVLGVALGNVVRGVPLDETGWFHEDLFTNLHPVAGPAARLGAVDVYTALVGVFALLVLAAHGATFLVWKTTGDVHARASRAAARLWPAVLATTILVTGATAASQPHYFAAFAARPWLWPLPAVAAVAGALVLAARRRRRELAAFLASCTFLATLLAATAATLYPTILRSTVEPRFSLDAFNASSARPTLALGLAVLVPALALAVAYFTYLYRSFRGKVTLDDAHD